MFRLPSLRRKTGPPPGGMIFGPLLIGLAYGLAQFLPKDPSFGFFYWQSPFLYTALAGVAIAFSCRPILSRIDWTRSTAMLLALALLLGIGPFGDWVAATLLEYSRLAAFPLHLPDSGLSLLLGALAAAVLMALFFRKPGGAIGGSELWSRIKLRPVSERLGRMVLLACATVGFWLLLAWVDARWEEGSASFYIPLVEPNPWLRLEGLWMASGAGGGAGGVALFLAIFWLRALAMLAPLVPLALTLRGTWTQLTLVFGILLFVLSEFAPLMVNQPYPSLAWLLYRTGLGLGRAAVLGGATAALFGIFHRRE